MKTFSPFGGHQWLLKCFVIEKGCLQTVRRLAQTSSTVVVWCRNVGANGSHGKSKKRFNVFTQNVHDT
jgi:hypothetical protein